ncbi:MAG: hypothetical protein ABI632_12635 [Pseudolysinimonas sp.]
MNKLATIKRTPTPLKSQRYNSSLSFRRAGMNATSGGMNLVPIRCFTASLANRLEKAMLSAPTSKINHGSHMGA